LLSNSHNQDFLFSVIIIAFELIKPCINLVTDSAAAAINTIFVAIETPKGFQ
jgi:hypothetical protein